MRKPTLAVIISSVLLSAAAVQAEPREDPAKSQQAQDISQTVDGDSDKASTSAPPDANAAKDTSSADKDPSNPKVGSPASNVDEQSSSGSYYPNSAGTVGDTPAKPKSTSPEMDGNDEATGPTDQWGDADADGDGFVSQAELKKIAPALSENFSAMDVDNDKQLSRGEFRTWHESHKAKLDDGDGESSKTDDSTPGSSTPPDTSGE